MTSIAPHGGTLCNMIPNDPAEVERRRRESVAWPSITLTTKQLCDVELLLNGAFSPLTGFLNQADYHSVLTQSRLTSGLLWPVPINLDLDEHTVHGLKAGDKLVLRDKEGNPLAVLTISDIWEPDKRAEARAVFGTDDPRHPGVTQLLDAARFYAGGELSGIQLPNHFDFSRYRHTPQQIRDLFATKGYEKVVAFQTRNPLHRVHEALMLRAVESESTHLLLHPVIGLTQPGDLDYVIRVHTYRNVVQRFPDQSATLSLLPLAMRMAGPREALWHAIIRKNYGCSHFIVGRDHAGPGPVSERRRFYEPYQAQDLVAQHADELGMTMLPSKALVYVPEQDTYLAEDAVAEGTATHPVGSTDLRNRLRQGASIPSWLMHPDDVAELRKAFPPRSQQGFTVFFTGLSGAGKSTVAKALYSALQELGRPITLLDGDVVRLHLSKGLGFSKEDRDTNVQRIGYVASLITKCGGLAICAPIAPYRETRRKVREMIAPYGGFVEVHVATPLDVCEDRDPKGLYAKARAGKILQMTGIDDPYEAPENPELRLDTSRLSVREAMQEVLQWLQKEHFLQDIE